MNKLKEKYISDWGTPIIPSLMYLDLYKLTMLQFFMNQYPNVWAKYNLKVRSDFDFTPYLDEINFQLDELCKLKVTDDELTKLRKISFLKTTFVDKLRDFSMDRNYVHAYADKNGKFQCYSEGPLNQASLFEVYVLAILQEIRSRVEVEAVNLEKGEEILTSNIEEIKEFSKQHLFQVADFSCRRAVSVKWLDHVINRMSSEISSRNFTGTSCVYFAMKYDITPIGTMAHEAQMLGQSQTHPFDSIEHILEGWAREYHGDLGIALSDTFGSEYFFAKAFHKGLALQYNGLRHDSGDPIEFGERAIEFYKSMGIDPLTKTLVFSDGLTIESAFNICRYFNGRIRISFGIGTNIGNALGIKALQIVMKLVEADGKSVIKVSDSPGKGMCDDDTYAEYITTHIKNVVDSSKALK